MDNPFNRFDKREKMYIKHHVKMTLLAKKLLKVFPKDEILEMEIKNNIHAAKNIVAKKPLK